MDTLKYNVQFLLFFSRLLLLLFAVSYVLFLPPFRHVTSAVNRFFLWCMRECMLTSHSITNVFVYCSFGSSSFCTILFNFDIRCLKTNTADKCILLLSQSPIIKITKHFVLVIVYEMWHSERRVLRIFVCKNVIFGKELVLHIKNGSVHTKRCSLCVGNNSSRT